MNTLQIFFCSLSHALHFTIDSMICHRRPCKSVPRCGGKKTDLNAMLISLRLFFLHIVPTSYCSYFKLCLIQFVPTLLCSYWYIILPLMLLLYKLQHFKLDLVAINIWTYSYIPSIYSQVIVCHVISIKKLQEDGENNFFLSWQKQTVKKDSVTLGTLVKSSIKMFEPLSKEFKF